MYIIYLDMCLNGVLVKLPFIDLIHRHLSPISNLELSAHTGEVLLLLLM